MTHRSTRNQQALPVFSGHLVISDLCLTHGFKASLGHLASTGWHQALETPQGYMTLFPARQHLQPGTMFCSWLKCCLTHSLIHSERLQATLPCFLDPGLHRARLNSVVHSSPSYQRLYSRPCTEHELQCLWKNRSRDIKGTESPRSTKKDDEDRLQ